jgi:hypothetical protein
MDTYRKNDVLPAPELPNTIAFTATGLLASKWLWLLFIDHRDSVNYASKNIVFVFFFFVCFVFIEFRFCSFWERVSTVTNVGDWRVEGIYIELKGLVPGACCLLPGALLAT